MPEEVQDTFGYALHLAQAGDKHSHAKPLKGFGGAGVLEVMEDHQGDTYRALCHGDLCGALLPEKIDAGHRHTQAGPGFNRGAIESRRRLGKKVRT